MDSKRVFDLFREICTIPHGSGNCREIAAYCMDFAEKHGLDAVEDACHNIVIRKPASCGYESHEPILLQAHLDMVCESERMFDFEHDPVSVIESDDYLLADATTLGADDGIGVAMILAVLEDDSLRHPPIEAVLTTDEETGMIGAQQLSPSLLTAKKMLNLDSEEEGVLTVGCAGGTGVELTLPLETEENALPCYRVVIDGLQGGHSGTEIHKGHSNAVRCMGKLLSFIGPLKIVSVNGGRKDNAIPTRCEAIVAAKRDPNLRLPLAMPLIENPLEPDMRVTIESVAPAKFAANDLSSAIIMSLLQSVPNGVQTAQADRPNIVTCSLNMGIVKTEADTMHLRFLLRSNDKAGMERLLARMQRIAREHGASMTATEHNAPWEPVNGSALLKIARDAYTEQYGADPVVVTVHAGLECGIFAEKIDGLDAVSFGPTILGAHTDRERVSIASTERTFEYLCRILAAC